LASGQSNIVTIVPFALLHRKGGGEREGRDMRTQQPIRGHAGCIVYSVYTQQPIRGHAGCIVYSVYTQQPIRGHAGCIVYSVYTQQPIRGHVQQHMDHCACRVCIIVRVV
jgi:quinol monooxygenase YgiN